MRVMTKSSESVEQWLELYGDSLFKFALARVRNVQIAEDLVQETFLAAIKARDSFEQRSQVKTWLTGILKHKIIDHQRRSAREQNYEDADALFDELRQESFDASGHWQIDVAQWSNPDQALEREEFWAVMNRCLDELPEKMREIFLLREMEGLSAEEICKALPVSSTNNVWVILSRLRMKLRQCLELRWFNRAANG